MLARRRNVSGIRDNLPVNEQQMNDQHGKLSLAPNDSVRGLLELAKREIAGGEKQLRLAAEHIAAAEEKGTSQREIAFAVGKSAAWVNRLLQWRRSGYLDSNPFGAQSRESRSRAQGQAPNRSKISRRLNSIRYRKLQSGPRQRLIGLLGMLGSKNVNERASAAAKVEDHRLALNMSWDELIVQTIETDSAEAITIGQIEESDDDADTEEAWN
jgi:hypothetical protein